MTKQELIKIFKDAIDTKQEYIGVAIEMPNGAIEIIINLNNNFKDKIDYYKDKYDDELRMKNCPSIKIVNAYASNRFETLEDMLIFEVEYSETTRC
ncbi:Uncharacterised protein [[Clostridium] sordellii]|uniref:Uncharacterized protein n=1 Tax=Paraclostridium sordellii TaxID=1505 RepID=A0A0C7R4C2_PARSO|nr:hypothetical protein [Paeniclostridium sordellii]CEQ04093.1 Uncharacterised protein [[Clostridium] sordellii] [Paeniclostridium sordellii]